MVSKRTKSRRRRLKRGGHSRKEYELIGQSALEDEIDILHISLYVLGVLLILSFIFLIGSLMNANYDVSIMSFITLLSFGICFIFINVRYNRIRSSKHTKSRIYRAGIDKVQRDKRALEESKKYKASYVDKSGRAFTLSRRKAKFSKKRKGSRKSRK